MTCDPIALNELFFDELPADEAAQVQRHARGCGRCTRQLDELRADRERFATRRSAPPAFDRLFRGIERQLAQRARPRATRRWMIPHLLRFAAGSLALVLALFATAPHAHRSAFPASRARAAERAPDASIEAASPLERELAACLISTPGATTQSADACF